MKLPPRQRLLAIIAGSAVGLLILDSAVYTPLVNNWTARSAQIATLNKNIAAGRSSIERAQITRSNWDEMQRNALPKDAALAEQQVLSAFDQWGRSTGIELGSIKPQWKRGANTRYSLLECRVDAVGSLSTLTRFLFEVEKSSLPLRVESLELSARDPQGDKLSLSLVVSGLRLAPLEGRP